MRPLEATLVATLILAFLIEMTSVTRLVRRLFVALVTVLFVLHVYREGAHYQMLPAYLAWAILIGLQFSAASGRILLRPWLKSFAIVGAMSLCALSLALSYALPMFTLPPPTGSYSVGTTILYLTDQSRHEDAVSNPQARRELVVQVWYPALPSNNRLAPYRRLKETRFRNSYQSVLWTNSRLDAPVAQAGAPFPVVLFNHGWGGRRSGDTFLTEELASHGYVVVSIDHPYIAARVELSGGRIVDESDVALQFWNWDSVTSADRIADWNKELDKWTADQIFVLNSVAKANLDPHSAFFGRLNTNVVGAAGHSFGGAAALEVSGVDSRILSAVNMDGWTFGGLRYRTSPKPVMLLYEEASRPNLAYLHSADRYKRFVSEFDAADDAVVSPSLNRYGGYRIYIRDTTHDDFTDLPLSSPFRSLSKGGLIPPARMETIIRSYVVGFFDKTLKGKASPLLDSGQTTPYSEVEFEARTPEGSIPAFASSSASSGH